MYNCTYIAVYKTRTYTINTLRQYNESHCLHSIVTIGMIMVSIWLTAECIRMRRLGVCPTTMPTTTGVEHTDVDALDI